MSQVENIALIRKNLRTGSSEDRVLLTDSDTETIHFNKNSVLDDPNTSPEITKNQIEALDRILYDNRVKYSGNTEYSSLYDRNHPDLDVDFIDKGKIVVRVMDKHNFYETEAMPEEYLNEAPVGLLTKLWIHISKAAKE